MPCFKSTSFILRSSIFDECFSGEHLHDAILVDTLDASCDFPLSIGKEPRFGGICRTKQRNVVVSLGGRDYVKVC